MSDFKKYSKFMTNLNNPMFVSKTIHRIKIKISIYCFRFYTTLFEYVNLLPRNLQAVPYKGKVIQVVQVTNEHAFVRNHCSCNKCK